MTDNVFLILESAVETALNEAAIKVTKELRERFEHEMIQAKREVIGFLFGMWFWWREYRKDIEACKKAGPIRPLQLHPMGALTFSYACIHCKHELDFNSQRCDRCMCEIESGFEPKSFEQEVQSYGRQRCQKST